MKLAIVFRSARRFAPRLLRTLAAEYHVGSAS